jgi:cobaltochelatase CobT
VQMPSVEDFAGHAPSGQAALARVRGESAKLTARLQGLVEAHQMAKNRTVRRGRALSPTALHRAAVGDDRVFLRKDSLVVPNTALHLIVDLSGSMCGFQDSIALDAAMALALALEPMRGVSCAVTAFPSLNGRDNQVTRILSHGDSVARNAGAFVQYGRGGTPMTGALWFAAADLLARREERKVIMTLTDGGPDDFDSAKEMVGKATAAGIEMIGVGIATRVDRLFPVAITIGSVTDLKGELFGIAEQLLLR